MRLPLVVLSIVLGVFLAGCTTIGTQQMVYVGDETKQPNIMGLSRHFDFGGMGVSPNAYAEEYNSAITDAFSKCPDKTEKLGSVKIFKAHQFWPQALGASAMLAGSALMAVNGTSTGLYTSRSANLLPAILLIIGGGVVSTINTYDFIVIAEPVYEE